MRAIGWRVRAADLTRLFTASSPQELVQRAGQVYANVVKTDFPSRAEAIAELLAADPPDVAGLQEVARWETGPTGGPLTPSYDFLGLVLAALAGDLNSRPDDRAGAYGTFTTSGYADAWVVVHGPEGGFTSGQSELLDNVPSTLDHRIDDVLYQPRGVEAVAAEVIGDELGDRTPAGLWPSDHAGVVATLHLARP
jgi:hypothetical protein